MKKWLITLVGFTMGLAVITGGGFALAGNGSDTSEPNDSNLPTYSAGCAEEVPDCNDTLVAGTDEEGTTEPEPCDPETVEGCEYSPVRSDENIDPNECNWIHNISACDDTGSGSVETDGTPEPGIAVGEPYPMPAPGTLTDLYPIPTDASCGPDQGIAITSDGQVSCLDIDNAGQTDDGQDLVSPGEPPAVEPAQ